MSTYRIFYGFGEGPWHGRELRRELRKKGYRRSIFKRRADVYVAHSGGCFLIPRHNHAKTILLIDIPYWPEKKLTRSLFEKVVDDYLSHKQEKARRRWWRKTLYHGRYTITRLHRVRKMHWEYARLRYPEPKKHQKIMLVRNERDSFCPPDIAERLPAAKQYELHVFPGGHDHCWHDPKPYVSLVTARD